MATDPDDPAGPTRTAPFEIDGRIYLAVYTSLGSLAYGLGDGVTHRETTYQQLADAWPDPDWRLAVNADSPIEVYVPIEQIAEPATPPPA